MADNALYQPRIDGEMRATQPRNALLGLLADALYAADNYAQRPNPSMPMGKANPPLSLLSNMLMLKDAAVTADRYNMRQDLTRGSGWATQMLPETANTLLSVGPAVAKFPKQAAAVTAGLLSGDAGAISKAVISFPPMKRQDIAAATREAAERFAGEAESRGLAASVSHSGSAMGPSSYVHVTDPLTGTHYSKPFRFSDHPKGAFEGQGVIDFVGKYDGSGVDISELLPALDRLIAATPAEQRTAMAAEAAARKNADAAAAVFARARPQTFNAFKEARDSGADMSIAFSSSGKPVKK